MAVTAIQTVFRIQNHQSNFTIFNNDCFRYANAALTGDAFRVWSWAITCKPDYNIDIRKIANRYGFKIRKIQRIISELIKHSFVSRIIIRQPGTGQFEAYRYQFFEQPPGVKNEPAAPVQKTTETIENTTTYHEQPPGVKNEPAVPIIKEVTEKVEVTAPKPEKSQPEKPPAAAAVFDFEIMTELKNQDSITYDDAKRCVDRFGKDYALQAIKTSILKAKDNPGAYFNGCLNKGPYPSILKIITDKRSQIENAGLNMQKAIAETKAAKELADKEIDFSSDDAPIIEKYSQLPMQEKENLFHEFLRTIKSEVVKIKTQRMGAENAIRKITYQIWLEKMIG